MASLQHLPSSSFDAAAPETPAKTWWDRSIFLSSVAGGEVPCPPVIDVTGRARVLVYGPGRELDPGVWQATVCLHLSHDAALRRMVVQFGPEADYTTVNLPLGVSGDHKVELTLTMHEAGPVQVQLCLKKAAFHGEVRFSGVSIERIADRHPDASDRAGVANV